MKRSIVFAGVLFCAFLLALMLPSYSKSCQKFADPVRVHIGDLSLSIPAAYMPIITAEGIQQQFDAKGDITLGYCQSNDAPPLDADKLQLSINPAVRQAAFQLEQSPFSWLPYLQFEVHAGSADKGFCVSAAPSATAPTLVGLPVAIHCDTIESTTVQDRLCRTWHHPLSEKSFVYFQFFESQVPATYWNDMMRELERFLSQHASAPLKELPNFCSKRK